jgi:hypothetical protein
VTADYDSNVVEVYFYNAPYYLFPPLAGPRTPHSRLTPLAPPPRPHQVNTLHDELAPPKGPRTPRHRRKLSPPPRRLELPYALRVTRGWHTWGKLQ